MVVPSQMIVKKSVNDPKVVDAACGFGKKNVLHPILRTEGETQPYTQPDQFLCTGSLWARLSLAFVLAASCNQNAVMIVKKIITPFHLHNASLQFSISVRFNGRF